MLKCFLFERLGYGDIYIYIYIYKCVCIYIYIYIYIIIIIIIYIYIYMYMYMYMYYSTYRTSGLHEGCLRTRSDNLSSNHNNRIDNRIIGLVL